MSRPGQLPATAMTDTSVRVPSPVLNSEPASLKRLPVVSTSAAASASGLLPTLERRHRVLLQVADTIVLFVTAVVGAKALQLIEPARAGELSVHRVLVAVLSLALSLHLHGLYRRPASRLRPSCWWRPWAIARCVPTAALLALGTEAVLFGSRMTLTASVAMTLPAVILVPLGRRAIIRIFGPPTITRILIVGSGQVADRLRGRLNRCPDTLVVGQADSDHVPTRPCLGRISEVPDLCQRHRVDRVIIAFSDIQDQEILEMVRKLKSTVSVSVIPRLFELHNWRSETEELFGLPLMHVPPASLSMNARLGKRALDLGVALAAIALTLPCWIAMAVAIRLDSDGPVFFRQERIGRAGRSFRIFKFRTMTADAWTQRGTVTSSNEVDGPLFKMRQDPRITRVGRFLRRTSLDELPQLINVVCGEMSLVGPRPLPTEESDRLDGAALTRFDVVPGITGLWQVSGRSDLSYADLQHLDSVYVRSWSLLWDLRIIWATPRSVFGGSGAY